MKQSFAIGLLLAALLMGACGQDRSDCAGVDTSQAPVSITRGESMDTYCWTDTCCRVYYH